jgi:hypothetical protein
VLSLFTRGIAECNVYQLGKFIQEMKKKWRFWTKSKTQKESDSENDVDL